MSRKNFEKGFSVIPAKALHRMVYRAKAGIQYFKAFRIRSETRLYELPPG